MDTQTLSLLIMGASKVVSEFIRYRPLSTGAIQPESSVRITAQGSEPGINKPSTAETITMLEARLNESLIALQPDLLDGARINGKACDCIKKHTDEMLAAVRELQSMASKPVYSRIRSWAESHNWTAEMVARHPPEFFVALVPEVRDLRKDLSNVMVPVVQSPAVAEVKDLARKVSSGEMTRDEAVSKIKEFAQASGHT